MLHRLAFGAPPGILGRGGARDAWTAAWMANDTQIVDRLVRALAHAGKVIAARARGLPTGAGGPLG